MPASGVPASPFPGVPASVVPASVFVVAKAEKPSSGFSSESADAGGEGQRLHATVIDWERTPVISSPGPDAPWQATAVRISPSNPRSSLSVRMNAPG